MKITLVGMGMGNPDTLTRAAWSALEQAQRMIGARRLLEALPPPQAHRLHNITADSNRVTLLFMSFSPSLFSLVSQCESVIIVSERGCGRNH